MNISVRIDGQKSMDPYYIATMDYDDGSVSLRDVRVDVTRKPPKITIKYPEEIKDILPKINTKRLEIEILGSIAKYMTERGMK